MLRGGRDITLVTWGAMVKETLAAAATLTEEGVSAEVVDIATLKPLDMETILASVEKTGRCVIVYEAALTAGFGAEIAARLAEKGLLSLLAPVMRVAGYDTVMPLPRLEAQYVPDETRILDAARRIIRASWSRPRLLPFPSRSQASWRHLLCRSVNGCRKVICSPNSTAPSFEWASRTSF